MVLESKSEIDDYIVETYQEYEIYKDENGQVIKKVPTSHFDTFATKNEKRCLTPKKTNVLFGCQAPFYCE